MLVVASEARVEGGPLVSRCHQRISGAHRFGLDIALNALGNAYMELAAGKDTNSIKQEEGPTNILGALVRQ